MCVLREMYGAGVEKLKLDQQTYQVNCVVLNYIVGGFDFLPWQNIRSC